MQIAEQFTSNLLSKPLEIYEKQDDIIKQSFCVDEKKQTPLATQNYDEEQIWFQLKQQQDALLNNKQLNWVTKLTEKRQKKQKKEQKEQKEDEKEFEEIEDQQYESDNQEASIEENEQNEERISKQNEDENLDYTDMQKFLEMAENEEAEPINLEDEADDDDDNEDKGKSAKYQDLWGNGEADEEDDEEEKVDENDIELEDDIFDEMRGQEMLNEESGSSNKNKCDELITKLEQKLISTKSWQLKGEITGINRPIDSLVKENLDFKSGIRLQEEITAEDNDNLEKIIKQRVLDELWDDNEQNKKDGNIQENFNELPQLNFEKPKGLAETYEEEYKSSVLQLPTAKADDKLKAEIELQFKQLCYKLDLLSNLNFTPKPIDQKSAEIVTNVPTILREEKIPIFISQKKVIREKELFKPEKAATFFDKKELTPEEKLHLRYKMKRNVKSRQRHSILKKKISKLSASNKFAYNLMLKNNKQQKIMESMKKEKSVKFTKSADFFKNLQENQDMKKPRLKEKK